MTDPNSKLVDLLTRCLVGLLCKVSELKIWLFAEKVVTL